MDGASPIPKQKGTQNNVQKQEGKRGGRKEELAEAEGREGTVTVGLEDTEDLVTSDEADLGDAVGVTEGDTDLGGSETLAGEFGDVVYDVLGGRLEPRRGSAAVGEGRGRWKT